MGYCEAEQVALIPYGGGSSVVGGVEPPTASRYHGTITLDLKSFDRILEVDPVSRSARVQAGILGPALESGLRPYTLRCATSLRVSSFRPSVDGSLLVPAGTLPRGSRTSTISLSRCGW